MSRSDRLTQCVDGLNARDFVAAAGDFADNVTFHAPGLGLEAEGRDAVMKHVSEFVQQADVHYELEQVVEHGPFVVAFVQPGPMRVRSGETSLLGRPRAA